MKRSIIKRAYDGIASCPREKIIFLCIKALNALFSGTFPVLLVCFYGIEKLGAVAQAIIIIVALKTAMLFTSATLIQKIAIKGFNFKVFYINQFYKELFVRIAISSVFFIFGYYFLAAAAVLTICSCFRENVSSSLGVNGRFFEFGILSYLPNSCVLVLIITLMGMGYEVRSTVFIAFAVSDVFFFFLSWIYIPKISSNSLESKLKVEISDFIRHYVLSLPTAVQSSAIAYFSNHTSLYNAGLFKIINTVGSFGGIAGLTIKEFVEPEFKEKLSNDDKLTNFIDQKWKCAAIIFGIIFIPVTIIYGKIVDVDVTVVLFSAYGLCVSFLLIPLTSPHVLYLYKMNREILLLLLRWGALVLFAAGVLFAMQFDSYMAVVYLALSMILSRIIQSYVIVKFAYREL